MTTYYRDLIFVNVLTDDLNLKNVEIRDNWKTPNWPIVCYNVKYKQKPQMMVIDDHKKI